MIGGYNTRGHRQVFAMIIVTLFVLSIIIIPDPKNVDRRDPNNDITETVIDSFIFQPETKRSITLNAISEDGVISGGEYDQSVTILDTGANGLDFYYTINEGTGKIHFGITAPGTGYVSIGWGATNKMRNADIIWGGYSTVTYYEDTFGTGTTSHSIDASPDIDSCVASDDGSKTVLECTRDLDTGDIDEDVVITKDTQTTLIMGWHLTSDNIGATHDYRGELLHTWTVGATATVPDAPTNLSATKGNTFVDLSWDAPIDDGGSPLTGYNIYQNSSLLTTVGPTPTTYNDTGLTNGDNYVYTVSAINAIGEGGQSSSANATPSTTPGIPTGLTATKGNTFVDLSWTAPVNDGAVH